MSKSNSTSYQAPALEKGLDILEYLSAQASPLSQTEIASGIDKTTNEIFRMLVCLEERGYVIREEISGKYRLSLKLFHLSHRHSPVDEIRRVARLPMQELSEITNQACHLGVIFHEKLMVIYQSKSPGPITLSVEEGSLFPLTLTASGRTLLAFMEESERLELLQNNDSYKKYSKKGKKKFLHLLNQIREQGYYARKSEVTKGVTDVVVPIGYYNSHVTLASLAVTILTTQIEETISIEEIKNEAQKTVDKIHLKLGQL